MVASPAALFASRPSDRPSLLCLFVRRLSGTSPSLVRVVDPSFVFLLESSLSYRCLVARPLGSIGHCVRFGSAVRFYTPRGTAGLDSTRPAFLFLLVAFGRHAVHTHSVPRVVSRHSVITHLLSHNCSHRVVAWCGRARDSMGSIGSIGAVARCVVAARLPPSAISVRVQCCNAVQCSAVHTRIQQMGSVS